MTQTIYDVTTHKGRRVRVTARGDDASLYVSPNPMLMDFTRATALSLARQITEAWGGIHKDHLAPRITSQ